MSKELLAYIQAQPRGGLRKLATAIDAHEPDVSRWARGTRPIPVHYAAAIEIATGGQVTRKAMFPSSWADLWPELAPQKRKPAQKARAAS